MSNAHPTTEAAPHGLIGRALRKTPIIGRVLREIDQDINNFFWLLPILVLAMVGAIYLWGFAALVLTAIFAVPCMFLFFIAVTMP